MLCQWVDAVDAASAIDAVFSKTVGILCKWWHADRAKLCMETWEVVVGLSIAATPDPLTLTPLLTAWYIKLSH